MKGTMSNKVEIFPAGRGEAAGGVPDQAIEQLLIAGVLSHKEDPKTTRGNTDADDALEEQWDNEGLPY